MPRIFGHIRDLPNRREVVAWAMYDFANQSFTLLIITLLFSLYFKQVVVGDAHIAREAAAAGIDSAVVELWKSETESGATSTIHPPTRAMLRDIAAHAGAAGDRAWSIVTATSLFLVVLASPLLGAMADARQLRKEVLMGTGILCVLLTASLAILHPGWVLVAALLFIPANFCYQIGENFLASFLPDVSTQRNIGRISAFGWTMGYVGALCLLVVVAASMLIFDLGPTQKWPPFFIFAAVWFAIGIIPAGLYLRERKHKTPATGSILTDAVHRITSTLAHAHEYRQLAIFLTGFFVYAFGVQTVINFASIIAADFGIQQKQLVFFVLQLTITAGIGAIVTGRFQDRIGAKTTVIIFLVVWLASTLGLLAISLIPTRPQWTFWAVGNGIGLGLGGIGTASRSMVGRFTPRYRSAEFFGLWGLSYKLAGAIGVLSFGMVKASLGTTNALILLASFFAIGMVIVLCVNEKAGVRAAVRAQRDHQRSITT